MLFLITLEILYYDTFMSPVDDLSYEVSAYLSVTLSQSLDIIIDYKYVKH